MSDYFGGRGFDQSVGCVLKLIAAALIAIGAAVGFIIGHMIWGGA
jgi:hypothetical protein